VPGPPLDVLGRSFARDLRAEGRSARTVVIYNQALRFFAEWLEQQDRTATLDELTRPAIRQWLADLTDRGLEPGTVRTRFAGMRRFCRWLHAEGELAENPMAGMEAPAPKMIPVPVLSDDDLAALVKACGGKDFADRRDEAMIRVLLDCGIRAGELIGMTLDSVDIDRETAIVTGKGSRTRAVYFGARTARALDRYLRLRSAHRWAHLDALWLGQRGALTHDGAARALKGRAAAAGVEGLHAHVFRHTFAHDYLANGGQERDLMRLAGWSDPAMLSRYGASAADARAREAAKRLRRGDRV
jgi:site-specific recombinase XerD